MANQKYCPITEGYCISDCVFRVINGSCELAEAAYAIAKIAGTLDNIRKNTAEIAKRGNDLRHTLFRQTKTAPPKRCRPRC